MYHFETSNPVERKIAIPLSINAYWDANGALLKV